MPPKHAKKGRQRIQGPGGRFQAETEKNPAFGESSGPETSDDEGTNASIARDDFEFEEDSEDGDISSSESLPEQAVRPQTRAEWRKAPTQDQTRKASQKAMRIQEWKEAGQKDKTGIKRGPYTGGSERTVQRMAQRAREEAKDLEIDDQQLEASIERLKKQTRAKATTRGVPKKDKVLESWWGNAMVAKRRSPSVEIIEPLPSQSGSKRPRHEADNVMGSMLSDEIIELVDPDKSGDQAGPSRPQEQQHGELPHSTSIPEDSSEASEAEGRESKVPKEEEIDLEWGEALNEEEPERPTDIPKLKDAVRIGLVQARKAKDYRSELLFACLNDFYKWVERNGRIRASLRVATNHGHGPAFAKHLRIQARHVETTGRLKESKQGQRQSGHSMLDDEDVFMGVQHYLRTLTAGQVRTFEATSTLSMLTLTDSRLSRSPLNSSEPM